MTGLWRWLPAVGALLLCAAEAEARPGGGHTYSGGGGGGGYSGGGGSGGGGGGELAYLLIRLIFAAPHIGIPVAVVVVGGYIYVRSQSSKPLEVNWDSGPVLPPPAPPELDTLRSFDHDFSEVLFQDFLYHLYAEAQGARHDAERLAALAPYLSPTVRDGLANRRPSGQPTSGVVIGAMSVTGSQLPPTPADEEGKPYYVKLSVRFEANMTCGSEGDEHTYYVVETWSLARAATATSRPPETTRALRCPNCAAPFTSSDQRTCDYCAEVVTTGRFDWLVTDISVHRLEERPPALAGHAPERGTHDATITHPQMRTRLAELAADDPAFTEEAFIDRVELIFAELYAAWTADDLGGARPFVSDGLCDYLRYWLDAYRAQGLKNVVAEFAPTSYEIARVTRDRHYDAITVRLWASAIDYTARAEDGRIVGGSDSEPRRFSEYWTLIRSARCRGAPATSKQCPNCGGPLTISMGGSCEHCQAHITSGEFDWILSRIEQDESYRG